MLCEIEMIANIVKNVLKPKTFRYMVHFLVIAKLYNHQIYKL